MKKLFILFIVVFTMLILTITASAWTSYDFVLDKGTLGLEGQLLPDTTYHYSLEVDGEQFDVNTSNFIIEKETHEGGSYISSFGTSSDNVSISTRESYTIRSDDPKEIDLDMDLEAREDITVGSVTINEGDRFSFSLREDFGNDVIEVIGYDSSSSADTYDGGEGNIYWAEEEKGYVIFENGSLDAVLYMSTNERVYIDIFMNPIDAVRNMYDTSGAMIDYYQFAGKPTIRNTATLRAGGGYSYAYHMADDGTLTPLEVETLGSQLTWEVDGQLESYVVSTKALTSSAPAVDETEQSEASQSSSVATTSPPATTTPPATTSPPATTTPSIDGPEPVDPAKPEPEISQSEPATIPSSAPEIDTSTETSATTDSGSPSWLVFVLIGLCVVVVGACVFVIRSGQGGRHTRR